MMASAFDGLPDFDVTFIKSQLWAGAPMSAIRAEFTGLDGKSTITAKRMREMRDELFEPLIADPEKVRELADGPCINALVLNKPRRAMDRHKTMARAAAKPIQIEMFPC